MFDELCMSRVLLLCVWWRCDLLAFLKTSLPAELSLVANETSSVLLTLPYPLRWLFVTQGRQHETNVTHLSPVFVALFYYFRKSWIFEILKHLLLTRQTDRLQLTMFLLLMNLLIILLINQFHCLVCKMKTESDVTSLNDPKTQ